MKSDVKPRHNPKREEKAYMKNKRWTVIGAMLVFAFALGAMAPGQAAAAPRDSVWLVGDNTNKILKDGTFQVSKPTEMSPDSSQSGVQDSTTIITTAAYQIITSSGGIVTLTNTPSISTTTAASVDLVSGKMMTLRGTSDANAVVLQDDDTLAGSQLELGATSRSLGANDILVLLWDSTAGSTGRWLEVTYSNLD